MTNSLLTKILFMKYLWFLLTLCFLMSVSQVYSQGMNYSNSGQNAVEGFLETSMAKYGNDSEEMLSYILPSFRTYNFPEKVNFYDFTWKYIIEKTQGNIFFVTIFISNSDKTACKLVAFQTGQVNGRWYLVPTASPYGKAYVNPWIMCSNGSNYVSGTGPYEVNSILANDDEYFFSNSGDTQVSDGGINFDEFCALLLEINSNKDRVLVKSWSRNMTYPSNPRLETMKIPRLLDNEMAQYYIRLELDYIYLLIVAVDDQNLQPRATAYFTPENTRLIPEETFENSTIFPYTALTFNPLAETEEINISGFVDDATNTTEHKLKAFLFKTLR